MSIRDMESQAAWEALGTVQRHPQIQQWLAESDTHATLQRGRWKRWAAAASVMLAVGVVGIYGVSLLKPQHYATGIGEQRDIVLEDGSLLTLNTDTAVTVRYNDNIRWIELTRGEALFSVKQDRSRPFEVTAGETVARALGTEFNVDMRHDKVTVSVLDGAVRVSTNEGDTTAAAMTPVATLSKGQAVEIPSARQQPVQIAQAADVKRIDAWRTRKLEFSDTPLKDAVEEFNRYSTTRIVIGSQALEPVRVSGVFRIGDADGFLYSLQEALGVRTAESAGEVVLMR